MSIILIFYFKQAAYEISQHNGGGSCFNMSDSYISKCKTFNPPAGQASVQHLYPRFTTANSCQTLLIAPVCPQAGGH